MGKILLILFLLCPFIVEAATINAASASRADVGTAVTAAVDGDTVSIPAGTATWTSELEIAKAITLQGAGMDLTVIADGITDGGPLISFTGVANQTSRLTGIGFEDGGRTLEAFAGVVSIVAGGYDARRVRIDHCRFNDLFGFSVFTSDVIGVIDHNQFVNSASKIFIYIYHENWGGYTQSDGSFEDGPDFGSVNFTFIEDNGFAFTTAHYAVTDAYRGARYVARYNNVTNGWWEAHGTDSGGRRRGTRAIEVYENHHYYNAGSIENTFVNFRSASGRVWNNTLSGYDSTPIIALASYRMSSTFPPFGYADGESPWDINDPSNPFVSGTASSGGTLTMTDSGKSWTTDQWAGYTLKNVTTGFASIITANTATTITFLNGGAGHAGDMSFSAGNTYRINKVLETIDQPGRGQGTRLLAKTITGQTHSGGTVTCTVVSHGFSTSDYIGISETETNGNLNGTFQITSTGADTFTYSVSGGSTISFPGFATKVPAGWNDQVDEPIYEWNNVHDGSENVGFTVSGTLTIRAAEHYVSDTAAPGYTPYTYPHPLTVESVGTISLESRGQLEARGGVTFR